jgi:hypothetical protein
LCSDQFYFIFAQMNWKSQIPRSESSLKRTHQDQFCLRNRPFVLVLPNKQRWSQCFILVKHINEIEITPWCSMFLEKLLVVQLVKKFPAFYENEESLPCSQEPVTGSYPEPVESSPHLSTLYSHLIQSTPSNFIKIHFNIIIQYPYVFKAVGLFPSNFLTKHLNTFLSPRACHMSFPSRSLCYFLPWNVILRWCRISTNCFMNRWRLYKQKPNYERSIIIEDCRTHVVKMTHILSVQ